MDVTRSRAFGRASARYGVLQAEATIAWTREAQALLAQPPEEPGEAAALRGRGTRA